MCLSDICLCCRWELQHTCQTALNIAAQQTSTSQANNLSYHLQLLSALFNKADRRKRALSNEVLFSRYSKYIDHHGINLKRWLRAHRCSAPTSYRYSTFTGLLARNICHELRSFFSSVKLNLSPVPLASTNGPDSSATVEFLLGVSWARGHTAHSRPRNLTTTVSIQPLCSAQTVLHATSCWTT